MHRQRPTFHLLCSCCTAGHPGTADYSSAPCPHGCEPTSDGAVWLRVADLDDADDREAVIDEHGLTCPSCAGHGGDYVDADDGYRWLDCRVCSGRGLVIAYDLGPDCAEAVEWIRDRAEEGDGYAADWLFSRRLLAWQHNDPRRPRAGEEAAE